MENIELQSEQGFGPPPAPINHTVHILSSSYCIVYRGMIFHYIKPWTTTPVHSNIILTVIAFYNLQDITTP